MGKSSEHQHLYIKVGIGTIYTLLGCMRIKQGNVYVTLSIIPGMS